MELVERVVVEGAGLKEEEAELTGDGSMEEAESMHRAESRDEVELLRLVDVVLRAFIQECSIHLTAVIRFLIKDVSVCAQRKELVTIMTNSNWTHSIINVCVRVHPKG